ncbi:scoloptoxin SSD14-like isoform X2 [Arctopsyche grandis]|uniref:scoloptoxin SSD14-like isoform X2 n=1 Tax=Arctopsyche grandis TaxID=121162 RepID=UPI00406D9322
MCCICSCLCRLIILGVVVVVAVVVTLLVVFLAKDTSDNPTDSPAYGMLDDSYKNAAVTANGIECAAIGRDILLKNGSAADAAIATLFCDGITCAQSMGVGGGFLLAIYTHATGQVNILNAREIAPAASTEDMFEGGNISTTTGGKAVAVPGELRGYQALHNKYGKLPWADLVQPTIDLCRTGYEVTDYFARVLRERKERILAEPSLSEIFINPETNDVWLEGEKIKRLKLAETLEIIARDGADALYNGTLTKSFIQDIQDFDGIITEEDMNNYKAEWMTPLSIDLGADAKLHTVPLPGSGHVLALMINALRGWVVPDNMYSDENFEIEENSAVYWHRITEIFKYAYAKRTGLGDKEFLPLDKIQPLLDNLTSIEYAHYLRSIIEDDKTYNNWTHYGAEFGILEDHGTAHISIVAPNGDAVAATSTINFIIGAFIRSRSTGIILNNEMDDFSFPNITNVYGLPPSPTNYVAPGKRPLSSMTPSIVVEKGRGARLIFGAAGGTKITTQVAIVALKHLLSGHPLNEVMDEARFHHQLIPMEIQHEVNFNETILQQLRNIGHNTTELSPTAGFAALTAISVNRTTGYLDAAFDKRRGGSIAGF